MKKNLLLLFILFPIFGFSQNVQVLREQAESYYDNGDFLKAYQTLNKIKDKDVLENTNVNMYKLHLENIMQYRFFKKTKLNDSLYKVYIKSNVLKSQGIYNEKSKKYTLPPVYDSIPFSERYFKYSCVYKNKQEAFVNIETGKVIVPLGNHYSILYGDYVLTAKNPKYDKFSYDEIISVFDLNGNLLFKDLNTFSLIYYPNYIRTKNKNNKYQIFDAKTKKVILDDIDYFFNPNGAIVENEIEYDNVWLPFRKNDQYYLYKMNTDGITDRHKFDTYIPLYSNFNYFDNSITKLINIKDNAASCPEKETRTCFFSYYTIVKKDNKYGIFNISKDQFYKEPIYDSISRLGNTFYNDKWINLIYGEEICPPDSDRYEGIVFKKDNLFGLMNLDGKIIVGADYDEIRYLSNEVFVLRKGLKWGFAGTQKEDKIVLPEFDYIDYLSGEFGNIACYKNKKVTKFLRNGDKADLRAQNNQKLKKHINFEESITNMNDFARVNDFDRYVFEKNGKFGLDDYYYNEILPATYSEIQFAKKNTFIASRGSKVGLIDRNGKEIIPVKCAKIEYRNPYSDLFYVTFDDGVKSIFNSKGLQLYPANIKEITNDYFDFKTKTDYVFVTEFSDAGEKNNLDKKEKSYINSALRIKDDKVERLKLEGHSFEFVNSNYIRVHNHRTAKVVFYNLKNGKIIDDIYGFNIINDDANFRFFATRANAYDTVVDSLGNEATVVHPFYEIKNDNYFFKEDDKTGVMNKNLIAANFRFPVLKNIIEKEYRNMTPNPSKEYREKASSYFKFNSNKNSLQDGVVKFDGTILFEPEIYDDIRLLHFGRIKNYDFFEENEFLKEYKNDLFACTISKRQSKTLRLITQEKEIIAEFEVKQNGNWNFCNLNKAIIIREADSVKLYDIKSKKILLKIKANQFQEDKDFGYTASYIDAKTAKNKYEKYSSKGQFIFDTIVDKNKQYYGSSNENYILKRIKKYGTINAKGKPGIPFEYDYLESKKGKLFISKKDNLFGIIDEDNLAITDRKYQDIKWVEIKDRYSGYETLFSAYKVKENNKFGLLGLNSEMLLPAEFDEIKLSKTIITAKKDSIVKVYDFRVKEAFSVVMDSVDMDFNNNYHLYKNGKMFYMDFNENITDKYPYISWEEQLKINYSKLIEEKYYLSKNDIIIYKTPVVSFKEVQVSVDFLGESLKDLLIQDENNFYGLYTEDLKQILPFIYNEIIVTNIDDFFIVKKSGKYGVINSKSEIVIPFEYDSILLNNRSFFDCKKGKKVYHITPQNKRIYITNIKKKK
ncbi:WG repeat-containing protein [Flavobacterium sp. MC2016-06]|uniref:WG repeat-containing protein n=1 Tax=Flavobacterium sp. MC2016-06 TaxID=2676308 RepID=UPI0018ACDF99|nr:WG repeat-containing protein [Flavobacterium sp. MC2016-06]MBU3857556.1 WG repeat-containing protein [Flavobacterium sp. MC2016-06]